MRQREHSEQLDLTQGLFQQLIVGCHGFMGDVVVAGDTTQFRHLKMQDRILKHAVTKLCIQQENIFCCMILTIHYFDGLVQEKRNSSALAMELRLFAQTYRFVVRQFKDTDLWFKIIVPLHCKTTVSFDGITFLMYLEYLNIKSSIHYH